MKHTTHAQHLQGAIAEEEAARALGVHSLQGARDAHPASEQLHAHESASEAGTRQGLEDKKLMAPLGRGGSGTNSPLQPLGGYA